jgi:CBS domain-containing protein
MNAASIMTSPVQTIAADASLEQAARLVLEHKIGCLPVVDTESRLCCILTEPDFTAKEQGVPFSLFRASRFSGSWLPAGGAAKIYAAARRVADVMDRNVVSVDVAASRLSVLTTMLRTGYHRLPVVPGGVPLGVIARHDLLRLMVPGGPFCPPPNP